jgi:hypothetical protein
VLRICGDGKDGDFGSRRMRLSALATIGRTGYHTRIHMAILRVCDVYAPDAADRSALTARHDLLFMDSFALCLYGTRYVCTRRVVL